MGIGPDSVIEWDEDGDNLTVRRSGLYASRDRYQAVFPEGTPQPRTLEEMKRGTEALMQRKHPRPTRAG
jgi:hypothetical protein